MKVIVEINLDNIQASYKVAPSLEDAVRILNAALTTDEAYFTAWQANIAMAFKDNAAWFKKSHTGKRNVSNDDIHRIANKAADYFIEQLTQMKIEDMKWNKPKDAPPI